jgi:hypothetical protein
MQKQKKQLNQRNKKVIKTPWKQGVFIVLILKNRYNEEKQTYKTMKKLVLIMIGLLLAGKVQSQTEKIAKIAIDTVANKIINIPAGYKTEFIAKDVSGGYYLVLLPIGIDTATTVNDTTWNCRVFRGYPGELFHEEKVYNFIRFNDGGTTIIQTTAGPLYFPTLLQSNLKPNYNFFVPLVLRN